MKNTDLPSLSAYTLAPGQTLYRIQRAVVTSSTVQRGPLKLAPPPAPGGFSPGRFDLPGVSCAYFAASPETALYETHFRREKPWVTLDELKSRELLTLSVGTEHQLHDLRGHAQHWPVLQSLRYGETQELARDARAAGFDGIIYRSAQHYDRDCIVLFDPRPDAAILHASTVLINPGGLLHRLVADAVRHSGMPLLDSAST